MKKIFFGVILLSILTTLSAQEGEVLMVMKKIYIDAVDAGVVQFFVYNHKEGGVARTRAIESMADYHRLSKLSHNQERFVNTVLNSYTHTTGDTYTLSFAMDTTQLIIVVIEYTSHTVYNYWAYYSYL